MKNNIILGLRTLSIFLLFFSLFQAKLFAQDFNADWQKHQALMSEAASLSGVFVTDIFDSAGNYSKEYSRKTKIAKKGSQFHYDLEEMTMIFNENYSITHEKSDKIIVVNQTGKEMFDLLKKQGEEQDMSAFAKDAIYKGVVGKFKLYTYQFSKSEMFDSIEFYFEENSGLMQRTVYNYNNNIEPNFSKMEVKLENFKLNPSFNAGIFSETSYVSINDNLVSLNPKFQDYTLIVGVGLKEME